VTPDRALARRVLSALERWNVAVDDSGGDALSDTAAGLFARLAAEAALDDLEPVTLLALLKHPLLRLGAEPNGHARAVAALERAVLRGPRPKPGTAGLSHALATYETTRKKLHRNDPRGIVSDTDLAAAHALVGLLADALAPLETLKSGDHTLAALADHHRTVIENLSRDPTGTVAFAGNDGVKLNAVFDDLIDETPAANEIKIALGDYAEMFEAVAAAGIVRMREQPNVRVRIFGPLEARLQTIDRMVLGGLNEGSWPPETRSDPWLSRPMRRELKLNLPELRVGLTAHDFAQALGAKEVILTRAAKVAGAPAVTSRFVQRLSALAGKDRWQAALARGEDYLAWTRELDNPAAPPKAAAQPAPVPPREARPIKMSVTEIEHWLRDPYTIYAKHVLRLFPLDAVDTPPGAADRGSVIHGAIGNFTKQFADKLPDDPERELVALGEKSFAPLGDYPEAKAFWWPRFKRIADWFVAWERGRRPDIQALHAEIYGTLPIRVDDVEFILSGVADRIERNSTGQYVILDYKTGRLPGHDEVKVGFAPQLPLEGAILRHGGFPGIPQDASIASYIYVGIKGGDPAGTERVIKLEDNTADAQADLARTKLTEIVRRFVIAGEPYLSLMNPMWKTRYGDYDHLARVKEWSARGEEEEF
jgi:ATP-dependent helicase/nuclease subunit B